MRTSKLREPIQQYFRNTTLHGFKYLCSEHFVDRIGWLVCCCASTCCAGVLCAVLWARFLEVPALLALSDDIRSPLYAEDRVPTVAICPPPESIAEMFLEKLSIKTPQSKRIPATLAKVLIGKSTSEEHLVYLDELLASHNMTLAEMILSFTPACKEYTKRCRYQREVLVCEDLFEKVVTYWGMCCVMRPEKLNNVHLKLLGQSHTSQMIDLVLQCTHGSTVYGCQLITFYEGEEWVEPQPLGAGYFYMGQLRFTAVPEDEHTAGSLLGHTCERGKYSRTMCMRRCAERACGCRDPLQLQYRDNYGLPICPVARLPCLRANGYKKFENATCECSIACKKITTYMVLESSPMNVIKYVIDRFYYGLNVTSTVLNLKVNVGDSRVFLLNPTETWLTLLSSLGGVFNMFMGVGLFSALEFIFYLAKMPVAIRKASEIDPTVRKSSEIDPTVRYITPGTVR